MGQHNKANSQKKILDHDTKRNKDNSSMLISFSSGSHSEHLSVKTNCVSSL